MTIIFEVVIRQNTQYFVNHCVSNGFWSNRDFFIYNLLVCRVVVLKGFDRPVSFYIQTVVFEMHTCISQSGNSYKNQYTFHEKCTPIFLSIKYLVKNLCIFCIVVCLYSSIFLKHFKYFLFSFLLSFPL